MRTGIAVKTVTQCLQSRTISLAYLAVLCDPCDTKASMKAVSQSPQRNARLNERAGKVCKVCMECKPLNKNKNIW